MTKEKGKTKGKALVKLKPKPRGRPKVAKNAKVTKKKMGRPLVRIDWGQVEEMCKLQCTSEEISGVLGIDKGTLARALKREFNMTFTAYYAQKSSFRKVSLRRAQFKTAIGGNPTMQIWLGKNLLDQTDKQEVNHNLTAVTGIRLVD